jgi:putative transposase
VSSGTVSARNYSVLFVRSSVDFRSKLGINKHFFGAKQAVQTYAFKLYRTPKEKHLWDRLEVANEAWNFCITACRWYYAETQKHLSRFDLQKLITIVRNSDMHGHWKLLQSKALEDQSKRVWLAYERFFTNLKLSKAERKKVSPPGYKKRSKQKSWTLRANLINLDQTNNQVSIGGRNRNGSSQRWFKYHKSREVQGNIKTITFKRNNLGEWFIYVVSDHTETVEAPKTRTGKSVGFDFGLKQFLTGSNGTVITAPQPMKAALKEVKKAHRAFSHTERGSKNRKRALKHLNRVMERITNIRDDFQWKLAKQLAETYEVICLETLNLKGMKALWGRKVSDLAFYSFVQKLKHEAAKHDSTIVFIDRWFPSSKTCSSCGHKLDNLNLRDREWSCPSCKTHHDRDFNAAVNIHKEGMRLHGLPKTSATSVAKTDGASSVAGASVRPAARRARSVDRTITSSV